MCGYVHQPLSLYLSLSLLSLSFSPIVLFCFCQPFITYEGLANLKFKINLSFMFVFVFFFFFPHYFFLKWLKELDFWMNSIYAFTTKGQDQSHDASTQDQLSPPIILVGTHRNQLGNSQDDRNKLVRL